MIRKILIANCGEIALRIIRTCKEMRIRTVAVYSDADRTSLHVREADEAYPIGPPPPLESYLSIDKILEVAREARCDAIHPGYGFLSENAEFAEKVEARGFAFIGPSARCIAALGDKIRARKMMRRAGVPVVPGSDSPIKTPGEAHCIARQIGYPILVKAVGGGGGKGMRIVDDERSLASALRGATAEASSAFGDSRVYIEKYLSHPRHIELQVLGDYFGNLVHLGERECSIQRRFQKIIEESPSTYLSPELRERMAQAALTAARSSGYVNAGTVEFLVDDKKRFYFLEVNTRIQVEHPVAEMRTGIDIVEEQILIASGEKLRWKQEDIQPRGHAIECRIYAEDPEIDFMPSIGRVVYLRSSDGTGVRIDSSIEQGAEVSYFYDPLISKLVCWGSSREQAINRTDRALREYFIAGIRTTIPFCLFVINHPSFRQGSYDTHFVSKHFLRTDGQKLRADLELASIISTSLIAANKASSSPATKYPESETGWGSWKARRLEQHLR